MNNTLTLIGILSVMLLMSACSQTSQRSRNQQSTAYAYRVPQAQNQTQQQSPQPRQQNSEVISQNKPQQPNYVPMSSPAREQMVSIIKSTLGTPYKWGGSHPKRGFDCSGLMSYVHKNALGIKIPRTAAKQRDNSRTIDYAQLQPGDMLFFKTGKKTNHVGMYIGHRKFIHAPSGGKRVTVANMDLSYWHKRFVKFGTYIN